MTTSTASKDAIFLNSTKNPLERITDADTTVVQQIFTAGADGGAVTELTATSTDTVARIIVIGINNGTSSFIIGEVTVPAGAGTDGSTAPKTLLDPVVLPIIDADNSLVLQKTFILEVNAKVTLTAGKVIDIAGVAGDY